MFQPNAVQTSAAQGSGAPPQNLVLDAQPNAFTATGALAALTVALSAVADSKAYTLTGSSTTVLASRLSVANSKAYTLTGSAATTQRSRVLVASVGSLTLSPNAASLTASKLFNAAAGALSLTGSASVIGISKTLQAAAGSVVLTGSAASTVRVLELATLAGSVALTPKPVSLILSAGFSVTAGALSVVGKPVSLVAPGVLVADSGTVSITRHTASLQKQSQLSAGAKLFGPANYVEAGYVEPGYFGRDTTNLTLQRVMVVQPTTLVVSKYAAALLATKHISADSDAMQIAKADSLLQIDRPITITASALTLTGFDSMLEAGYDYPPPHLVAEGVKYGPTIPKWVGTMVPQIGPTPPTVAQISAAVRLELTLELQRIQELALLHGLVVGSPLTVSSTVRSAGPVLQSIGGDGVSTSTVTRQ